MNEFIKEQFNFDGMYLTYNGEFVARFKYQPAEHKRFIKFIMEHFTVSGYFGKIKEGYAPLSILEERGYVSNTVRKILKVAGYPQTTEGKRQYINDQIAKRK